MAISGIETLLQLGSLGEANFQSVKSLTAWEYLQQLGGIAEDSQDCCWFLGNTLEENKVRSLLKVPQ